MRCPKCGYISFDFVNNCEKCGKDLSETSALLGLAIVDSGAFSWFDTPETVSESVAEPVFEPAAEVQEQGEAPSLDLADIDVSDLISDEYDPDILEEIEEVTIIDNEVIETVAEDQEFQQALDEVIAE